jgi:hypothetical protein
MRLTTGQFELSLETGGERTSGGLEIEHGPEGRALMTAHFDGPGAKLVFFGIDPE